MFWALLKWLGSGPLDRILTTVDKKVDNETERQRIRNKTVEAYLTAQASILAGRGWWFPLFFIVPLGLYWTSVLVYSMLFCAGCAFPQDWTIGALPPAFQEWAGVIVSSLFIGKIGQQLIDRWRK